jgi:hypothetical protein
VLENLIGQFLANFAKGSGQSSPAPSKPDSQAAPEKTKSAPEKSK